MPAATTYRGTIQFHRVPGCPPAAEADTMNPLAELEAHITKRIAPCITLALFALDGSAETRRGLVRAFEDYVKRWATT